MDPNAAAWTPAAVMDLAIKLVQLALLLSVAWGVVRTRGAVEQTKSDVAVANKQLDGRMSQMMDLVERLTAMIGRMGGASVRQTDLPRERGGER